MKQSFFYSWLGFTDPHIEKEIALQPLDTVSNWYKNDLDRFLALFLFLGIIVGTWMALRWIRVKAVQYAELTFNVVFGVLFGIVFIVCVFLIVQAVDGSYYVGQTTWWTWGRSAVMESTGCGLFLRIASDLYRTGTVLLKVAWQAKDVLQIADQ